MIKVNFYFGLIIFFYSTIIHSQTPPYFHYSTADGLASSTVHDILQDGDGFIWFATTNGLNRFDGSRFITYKMGDGLNSNFQTSLTKDDEGNIFIANHEKGINLLRNKRIENYYDESIGKRFNISQLIWAQHALYTFESFGLIGVFEKGNHTLINTNPLIVHRLSIAHNNNLIALTEKGVYELKNKKLEKLQVAGLPDESFHSAAWYNKNKYLIGGNGKIYLVENNRVQRFFNIKLFDDNIVYNLLLDSQQNIWFSIRGKGIYYIPKGKDIIINIGAKLGLSTTQVNNMMEDNEGNIWVCTYGKGVFCLTDLNIQSYFDKDGLINNYINCIEQSESGKIILGTINGISILDKGKFFTLKYNSGENVTGYTNSFIPSKKHLTVSLTSKIAKSSNVIFKDVNFRFIKSQSFIELNKELYCFGSVGNNIYIRKDYSETKSNRKLLYVIGEEQILNRINYLFQDSKKNFWIATNLGLCKIIYSIDEHDTRKWKKIYYKSDPVLNSKLVFIYEDKKNNVWFAGSKGISRISLDTDSISSYTNLGGFDLSGSSSIVSDNLNRIWIGCNNGVFVYDGSSIKNINTHSGLASNEVKSLIFEERHNKIYAGTSNGLSEIDIQSFDHYKIEPPKIIVNKIVSGDSAYTNYSSLEFDRDKNNVIIDFSAINYSSPRSLQYKYKLNDTWFETNNSILNFSSLQNGTYNIEIIAKTQNSKWSKPYNLSFVIKPGFTETIWFKGGFFLIVFSAAASVILFRTKQKTKRINQQLEINERINSLKHEALSAMMNPHFIFNALNSVQYLINHQKNEEANDYIAMMAKLIRKNLDTAGSGYILLSEEINRLKLYLDLEKLRFNEKFNYEINIGNDVEADITMIPNMIIQPFVENSLWHGILKTGKSGMLTISFAFENVEIELASIRYLIIKITDDGIGIKEALKNKKEDHISKGIKIIEERLKLLSTKMELPKPIMIEDLNTRNEKAHGTEVIISLPPQLYKITSTD